MCLPTPLTAPISFFSVETKAIAVFRDTAGSGIVFVGDVVAGAQRGGQEVLCEAVVVGVLRVFAVVDHRHDVAEVVGDFIFLLAEPGGGRGRERKCPEWLLDSNPAATVYVLLAQAEQRLFLQYHLIGGLGGKLLRHRYTPVFG